MSKQKHSEDGHAPGKEKVDRRDPQGAESADRQRLADARARDRAADARQVTPAGKGRSK